MKQCSTSLIMREIQVKTTIKYHFALVRTAIIKKQKTASVVQIVEKREHLCTTGENVILTSSIMEKVKDKYCDTKTTYKK